MKFEYQKIVQQGNTAVLQQPMKLKNPLTGWYFPIAVSTKGNLNFYIDGINFGKFHASIYLHDPAVDPNSGNISSRGSAIYDFPATNSYLQKIMTDPFFGGKPDPKNNEIGGQLTMTFDDYAINTGDKNKILGHVQWYAKSFDWVGGHLPNGVHAGIRTFPGDGGEVDYEITYVGSNFNAGDLALQKAKIPAKFANQF